MKTFRIFALAMAILALTLSASAQRLHNISAGPTLPATCTSSVYLVDIHILTGASPGVYQCVSGAWSVMASGSVLPVNTTSTSNQYFTAYNASTGAFTKAAIAESNVTSLVSDLAAKAPIASPTFTGVATAPILALADTAQPTCDSSHRFQFNVIAGGTGVKDIVQVCAKSSADTYAWRSIY